MKRFHIHLPTLVGQYRIFARYLTWRHDYVRSRAITAYCLNGFLTLCLGTLCLGMFTSTASTAQTRAPHEPHNTKKSTIEKSFPAMPAPPIDPFSFAQTILSPKAVSDVKTISGAQVISGDQVISGGQVISNAQVSAGVKAITSRLRQHPRRDLNRSHPHNSLRYKTAKLTKNKIPRLHQRDQKISAKQAQTLINKFTRRFGSPTSVRGNNTVWEIDTPVKQMGLHKHLFAKKTTIIVHKNLSGASHLTIDRERGQDGTASWAVPRRSKPIVPPGLRRKLGPKKAIKNIKTNKVATTVTNALAAPTPTVQKPNHKNLD